MYTMDLQTIEKLDINNLIHLLIGSLIGSDKLTSIEECLDSKKRIEELTNIISNSNIARKSIYLRLIEAAQEIIRNDLILLSNNSIINDNH